MQDPKCELRQEPHPRQNSLYKILFSPALPNSDGRAFALSLGGRLRNDGEPQGAEVRIKRERRHVFKERGYNYK